MNKENLLQWYEKIESFVSKLPSAIQKPILKEISPIKELFLKQRPPRIVLLGDPTVDIDSLVNALFSQNVAQGNFLTSKRNWIRYEGRGILEVLDVRSASTEAAGELKEILLKRVPDQLLILTRPESSQETIQSFFPRIEFCVEAIREKYNLHPAIIGVVVDQNLSTELEESHLEKSRLELFGLLTDDAKLRTCLVTTIGIRTLIRFRLDGSIDRDQRYYITELAEIMAEELPNESKVEMARLANVKSVQKKIGLLLVHSMTTICGAVGTQPIPLADFPVLTSLQVAMITGIVYTTGREINMRLAAEFIATLGGNISLAIICREGARALLKFLPGWGNAISGGIAALKKVL